MCYRDIWPFWYSDAKMVDLGGFRQLLGKGGNGEFGFARDKDLDILPSWHQLSCLAAGLAPPPRPPPPPQHCDMWQQLTCLAALLVPWGAKMSKLAALLVPWGPKMWIFW